jgi:hypothetical protein
MTGTTLTFLENTVRRRRYTTRRWHRYERTKTPLATSGTCLLFELEGSFQNTGNVRGKIKQGPYGVIWMQS